MRSFFFALALGVAMPPMLGWAGCGGGAKTTTAGVGGLELYSPACSYPTPCKDGDFCANYCEVGCCGARKCIKGAWVETNCSQCFETGNARCSSCVAAFDCGPPSTNTTLFKCQDELGFPLDTPLSLWTALHGCVCGNDGKSGPCGAKCPKLCRGSGAVDPACQACVGQAVGTQCYAKYKACADDK